MAPPRIPQSPSDSTAPRQKAAVQDVAGQVKSPPKTQSPDPQKPLEGLRNRPEDSTSTTGNPYFPRYGSFAMLGIEDFLRSWNVDKGALRFAKAMSQLTKAILGAGVVGRPRVEPPEPQDQPLPLDVAEYEPRSRSLAGDWNRHYDLIAQQMQQGAANVH
jgi:hypothetical protein